MSAKRHSQYFSAEYKRDTALKKCREYFRDMDLNDDGRLSSGEFLKMIEYVGMELDTTGLRKAYEKADQNKDGTISYREFVDAYTTEIDVCNSEQNNAPKVGVCNRPTERDDARNKILKKCRDYFTEMDANGDGRLDPTEFVKMIEFVGVDADVGDLKRAYHRADIDGNGTISFKEFVDAYFNDNIRHETSSADSRKISNPININLVEKDLKDGCRYFWTSDIDGDGKLSISEFSSMLATLGMKLNKRDINKAFRVADENGDGYISFGEYIKAYLNKVTSTVISAGTIKEIYRVNDKSSKGFLSKEECFQTLRVLGFNKDDIYLDKMITCINKKQDGKITMNEYCHFLGLPK